MVQGEGSLELRFKLYSLLLRSFCLIHVTLEFGLALLQLVDNNVHLLDHRLHFLVENLRGTAFLDLHLGTLGKILQIFHILQYTNASEVELPSFKPFHIPEA